MRKISVVIAIFVAFSAWCVTPVAPQWLAAGDTIAILSLSSKPGDNIPYDAARVIESWGFKANVSSHALDEWHTFAGSHKVRRDELVNALRDPSVKAILSTRGGYGSANVLSLLPLDTLRRYPKWIIGYSDITGYLSAEVMAGNMGIHANMGGRLAKTGGTDRWSLALRDMLMGKMPVYTIPSSNEFNHEGECEGILIGGNMSVYGDLAGSEYDFLDDELLNNNDVILFIEDVGEPFSRIDRRFQYLVLRGVISRIKGLIVGRFNDCPPSRGYNSVFEMLSQYVEGLNIPIVFDFPVGHDEDWNCPLMVGAHARLKVTGDTVTLEQLRND